jgi:hypothetical protein
MRPYLKNKSNKTNKQYFGKIILTVPGKLNKEKLEAGQDRDNINNLVLR